MMNYDELTFHCQSKEIGKMRIVFNWVGVLAVRIQAKFLPFKSSCNDEIKWDFAEVWSLSLTVCLGGFPIVNLFTKEMFIHSN